MGLILTPNQPYRQPADCIYSDAACVAHSALESILRTIHAWLGNTAIIVTTPADTVRMTHMQHGHMSVIGFMKHWNGPVSAVRMTLALVR